MYQNTKISKNVNDLKHENTILFDIGNALDGFPMLLSLRESSSGYSLINAVDALKKQLNGFSEIIHKKYDEIAQEITHEFRHRSFVTFTRNNIEEEYYVEFNYFDNCHYKTAAQKFFGLHSPLSFEQTFGFNSAKTIANTMASFSNTQNEFEIKKKLNAKKSLAINTATQKLSVLSIPKDNIYIGHIPSRPYISESLDELYPSYHIKDQKNDTFFEVCNHEEYSTFMQNYSNVYTKYLDSILVKRQLILQKLAKSLGKINDLHQRGKIHGDIKPSNMLFDGALFRFIDSLDVPIGQVSIGFTKNYCSPEQVTASPVTPATDIYNIGLLILQLLEGVLVGPLNEMVIPTGKNNTTIVKVITKPSVYLDRFSHVFSNKEHTKEWKAFLERSLAYQPSDRFQDITAFHENLDFLLAKHHLDSSVKINANFGRVRLPSYADDKMYWVV